MKVADPRSYGFALDGVEEPGVTVMGALEAEDRAVVFAAGSAFVWRIDLVCKAPHRLDAVTDTEASDALRGFLFHSVSSTVKHRVLAELVESLDADERSALGLDKDRLEALTELEATFVQLAEGEVGLDVGERCLERAAAAFAVDPAQAPGDGALGRPVVRDPRDIAELQRQALVGLLAQPLRGIGLARQVLSLRASQAGKVPTMRRPTAIDRFFDADIEPAELRALVTELGEHPEPNPSLVYLNRELADAGVSAESIFGPLHLLRCKCGRVQGADARGERCGDCGVLCDDQPHRERTFATLFAAVGLVHPAMVGSIASALGRSEDEVRALADSPEEDGGPMAIRDALGERATDLLIDAIPVLPTGDRPVLRLTAEGVTTEIDHPTSDAYHSLLARLSRFDRLGDLDAPEVLLRIEAGEIQRAFNRLFAAITDPAPVADLDGWGPRPDGDRAAVELSFDNENTEPDDDDPPTMLWVDQQTVIVAREGVAAEITLASGEVRSRFEVGAARLQACDDSGRYVLASAGSGFFDDHQLEGFGCWDREAGRWLTTLPPSIPPVTSGKPGEPEDGAIYELARGSTIPMGTLGDRPTALCWSRGNHEVLESGDYAGTYGAAIRSTAHGLVVFEGRVLGAERWKVPMLGPDGLVDKPNDDKKDAIDEAMYELWEPRYMAPRPAAIARHSTDGWHMFLPDLIVATATAPLFWVGFAVEAACFSPDAERLMVLTTEELIEIEIEGRRIARRIALGDIAKS